MQEGETIRLKSLMSHDLLALDSGTRFGRPKDILIDPEEHRVRAVILYKGAVPEVDVIIKRDGLKFTDVIGVTSLDSVEVCGKTPELVQQLRDDIRVRGSDLYDPEGNKLGRIAQVFIDSGGQVQEYRVKKGFMGLLGKTKPVNPNDIRKVGRDGVILKEGHAVR